MSSPARTLCPSDAAVVVVDIQERLAVAMERREEIIARTMLLVRAAAIVQVPIVVTRQYPKGLGELEPGILEVIAEAEAAGSQVVHFDKVAFNCFAEHGFAEAVESLGRRQLVLAGMETHICIAQTALDALSRGYAVHAVADACCSRDDEHRELALARLGNAGAELSCAESAAYELIGCAGTPEFKRLLTAVKG